ncbi:hypothetical protein G3A56_09065 [Rhizobium oryzihabitans]|uniref:Large polyvalent protein associated domain-containing protein n=1 Tax=Rhizobium oryzihabitans TaxID=2267833 RepID=A0A7L5BGU7_9HYPH|nr:hypothetical protein [Rhizobium oryzihabitans]QIB38120.1 hypothetical protein G3A56_09065 [Rhizobium oryzihabitans]
MPTLEEYDAWKTKQEAASVGATDFILNNARKVDPDAFASDVKLGKAFGLSADLANAGRDMLQTRMDSLRNTSILKGSPRTAQWLKDADNARASWDDVENMSWFEGAARGARNTLARSVYRLDQMRNQYMLNQTAGRAQDREMSFGEILDSERETIQTPAGNVRPWINLSDIVSASARYIDARYADLIGTDDEGAAREYAGALAANVAALKSTPKSGLATQAETSMFKDEASSSLGAVVQNVGSAFLENPLGVLSWAMETMGEFAPQVGLGIAVTSATKNPTLGRAVGMSASYATERYTAPSDFLAEKGVDLGKAEGIEKLLSDPSLLKEANDRGVIRGAVISAFDALSFGLAGKALSRNPIAEALAQSAQQAVNGSLGEYAARKAAGQEIDWNEIIAEGLAEIASTPFDMGMAGRKFVKDRSSSRGAEEAKGLIDELGDKASVSKLRQRLDGSFMDFVGKATEGTPIQDVFVPAEKMQELFQSYRYDPSEFLGELPGVDVADWDTALATGGDIRIPTATYAAKLAGSDFDVFLRENMRFSPDAMTFAEAQEFNARASEIQMEAFEESEAARIADESERSLDVQELDEMIGRLRAAGRSTDVARFEAMPLIAMRRTMAARSGMTQEEFAQRNPLPLVRGAVPEGLQPKNVDQLTRQLAEMRSYIPKTVNNGPSLLEAISEYGGINDVGGELKSRDAAVIKRGKGKKTLRLARGGIVDGVKDMFGGADGKKHGIDDVAQAMLDAGYLQDNPVAIEYRAALENGTEVPDIGKALLEAIDEELRGNVQYAGEAQIDERAATMERNVAYLNELGVTLDDADDVIRAALEKAEAENGRTFGQATLRQKLAKLRQSLTDLVSFSQTAPRGESQVVEIAQVSDAIADIVEQQTGLDIHGYRHTIDSSAIRHILKNHGDAGKETARGMVPITEEDLVGIPDMIASADKIVTGAKGRRGEELVGYLKKLDDGTTLYIEEARRGRKALAAVSMRKYPATSDYSSIAKTISPNVRNDGGNEVTITDVPANSKTLFQSGARKEKLIWATDGKSASLVLTKKEVEYFDSIKGNDGEWQELMERAPSLVYDGKSMSIAQADMEGLSSFVSDERDGYGSLGIPPRIRQYFQQGDGQRRGSIQLPLAGASESSVIISLFESADLSTTIHESAHYFLFTLEDLRTMGPDIQEMHDAVRTWWGDNAEAVATDATLATGLKVSAQNVSDVIQHGTSGDAAIDRAVEVGMHEQFARGFEAYVMEGKAPSIELRSAFERFAQWLMRLYKTLRGLNVSISPEIRTVFDRMLATDEEIQAARSDLSDDMLFAAADAAGLSPNDYRQLVKLHDQSVDAANEKLRQEIMAPIKRETERWFKEEKGKVRDEVAEQINRTPVYRAWEWLGNRRWLGGETPDGLPDMRLDRQMLVDRYGEGVLKTLPRGRFTLYANEGGMDPDEVAGWFGFESGDALVHSLEKAQLRREAIDAETDRVMRERHGDVMRDGQIEERALDAFHNDKRAQFLAAELKVLKARAGDTSPNTTVAQAREAARLTVSRMQVRDAINSNRFLTAERKAANEAIKLARLVERENLWSRQRRRDVQSAVRNGSLRAANSATERANASTDRYNDAVSLLVEQKRRQLMNHMLYAESVKAAEEVEKAERFVSKLGKRSTRQNLAGDYLEAIDELLERYDFRKLSVNAEQRRGSLLAYVDRMKAEGRENELSIPDSVVQDARRRPYKQLSVEELRGIVDTLKNIEHTARLKQRLKDAKRERELDAVVSDIVAEFDENVKGSAPSRAKSGRGGQRKASEAISIS